MATDLMPASIDASTMAATGGNETRTVDLDPSMHSSTAGVTEHVG